MAVELYKATATILSAFDDDEVGVVNGYIEVDHCNGCGRTDVFAFFGDTLASSSGSANTMDEIYSIIHEAVWDATIGNGDYSSCDLGVVSLDSEIGNSYKLMILDIFNGDVAA